MHFEPRGDASEATTQFFLPDRFPTVPGPETGRQLLRPGLCVDGPGPNTAPRGRDRRKTPGARVCFSLIPKRCGDRPCITARSGFRHPARPPGRAGRGARSEARSGVRLPSFIAIWLRHGYGWYCLHGYMHTNLHANVESSIPLRH
mgnify:CR=1 FL=1